ncbi:MAG: hypothetical protein LBR33_04850, partial [Propionibacteriaceae bacterium]|nr:hypothetical protein [Propionibacteriaceae bacterium]
RLHLVENRALVAKADQALRALVEGCAEEGLDLPGLRAARLTDDHFQLFLTQPGPLPAPWVRTVDPSVWTCAFARLGPDPADGPAPGVTDAAAGTLGPEMAAGPAADAADVADVADPVAPAADDLPPAPYPALVCVGQDEEAAHLLLDLEQAGVLGVTGPAPFAAEAMAALAVELATSPWADDLTVTTTGALADLEARLGTGRLHHVTNLGPVVDGLAHRADLARAALVGADLGTDRSGLGPLHSARVHGVAGDAWYPEVLVLAGDVAADAAAALADLVAGEPRVAVAAVTAEPDLMGEYRIEFDGSGRATLQPFGLPFTPQRLSPAVLDSVSRIVRLAQVPVAAPADPLAFAELVAAAPELAAFAEPAPPLGRGVRPGRLGEEHVILRGGAPAPESQDPAAAPDTAADPAHPADPDAATPAVDEAEWAELVAALEGKPLATASPVEPDAAPARGPYLRLLGTVDVVGATGGVEASKVKRLTELLAFLVLHPGAAVADLDEAIWPDRAGENAGTRNTAVSKLRRWLGQTPDGEPYLPAFTYDASAVGCDWLDWQRLIGAGPLSQVPTERLAQAFGLIRGAPFAGVNRRGYRWSDRFHREMLAAIADVGEELARRRCQARDFTSAQTVLATALALVPGEERLWRLRVLTSYVTGDRESAKAAIASLWEWSDNLGLDLEAETLRLIAQVQHTPLLDGRMKPRSERRPTTPKPKTTA